ncbi:MAG: hypothetical protein K2H52_00810 [Lachnospiraceae bacterium]|nr:hypothetical protein [Lachnospiraceae bacterium]MDE6184573.1 hypothetical protein [Lachnospiraceae bacterium]MDE7285819.1 hypothetical protein [Lachnospiraceae bacterium]
MERMILAREEDRGMKKECYLVIFVLSLVTGFVGIPIGAILSAVMQRVLKDSSPLVQYGFFIGAIVVAMLIGFIYGRKSVDMKDHTVCTKCKGKMLPMTEMDGIFQIPAKGEEAYKDPLPYLAENMMRVPSVSAISGGQRGCYVCGYKCGNCGDRMVRIKDFLPRRGSCQDKGTYYFSYTEFLLARGKEDFIN